MVHRATSSGDSAWLPAPCSLCCSFLTAGGERCLLWALLGPAGLQGSDSAIQGRFGGWDILQGCSAAPAELPKPLQECTPPTLIAAQLCHSCPLFLPALLHLHCCSPHHRASLTPDLLCHGRLVFFHSLHLGAVSGAFLGRRKQEMKCGPSSAALCLLWCPGESRRCSLAHLGSRAGKSPNSHPRCQL